MAITVNLISEQSTTEEKSFVAYQFDNIFDFFNSEEARIRGIRCNTNFLPVIDGSITLDELVVIGASVTLNHGIKLGYGVNIGDGSSIASYCVLENHVNIGKSVALEQKVLVSEFTSIGEHSFLRDNSAVGPNLTIPRESRIASRAKLNGYVQIQGSRHLVNYAGVGLIRVGCYYRNYDYWMDRYKFVGEKEAYTEDQIREYKMHIDYVHNLRLANPQWEPDFDYKAFTTPTNNGKEGIK